MTAVIPLGSAKRPLAGAGRLGVRRLDAALAQWEEGVAGFRAMRVERKANASFYRTVMRFGIERLKVPDDFEVVWSPERG